MSTASLVKRATKEFAQKYYNALVRASTSEVDEFEPHTSKNEVKFEFRCIPGCSYNKLASHYKIHIKWNDTDTAYYVKSMVEDCEDTYSARMILSADHDNEESLNRVLDEMSRELLTVKPTMASSIDTEGELTALKATVIDALNEMGSSTVTHDLYPGQKVEKSGFACTISRPALPGIRQLSLLSIDNMPNTYRLRVDKYDGIMHVQSSGGPARQHMMTIIGARLRLCSETRSANVLTIQNIMRLGLQ
jgi:hypothetical protein